MKAWEIAGDLSDTDDVERTVLIAREAYGWTITDSGRVAGLVSGDMGYATTHIVINPQDLSSWAHFNHQPYRDAVQVYLKMDQVCHDMVGCLVNTYQHIKNIKDGISTAEDVLLNVEETMNAIIARWHATKTEADAKVI